MRFLGDCPGHGGSWVLARTSADTLWGLILAAMLGRGGLGPSTCVGAAGGCAVGRVGREVVTASAICRPWLPPLLPLPDRLPPTLSPLPVCGGDPLLDAAAGS